MNIVSQISAGDRISPATASASGSPDEPSCWDREAIAGLSPGRISFLTDETLVEVIDCACDFLPQPDVRGRLCYLDRDSLERLTYLVRQACRRRGY